MSQIKISDLPLYTGSTTGVYLVMNNSGETTTYKVSRENIIGASGTSGTSGTSGSSGSNGSSGTSGINGSSGSSGTSGSNGSSGSSGTSGSNGSSGTSGINGSSGTSGTSGTSGSSGSSGATGASGSSGTSGTSAPATDRVGLITTGSISTTQSITGSLTVSDNTFSKGTTYVTSSVGRTTLTPTSTIQESSNGLTGSILTLTSFTFSDPTGNAKLMKKSGSVLSTDSLNVTGSLNVSGSGINLVGNTPLVVTGSIRTKTAIYSDYIEPNTDALGLNLHNQTGNIGLYPMNSTGNGLVYIYGHVNIVSGATAPYSASLKIEGSTTITGSVNISNVIKLAQQSPLPTGVVGSLAVSGSNLFYHNGTSWSQIN